MNAIASACLNALLADEAYVENIGGGDVNAVDSNRVETSSQANFLAANFVIVASHESHEGWFDAAWQIKTGSALAGSGKCLV